MKTGLKRIFKSGFLSFWRNGFVSLSSVAVITITLFVIGSVIFFSALLHTTLDTFREKVDINAYFIPSASESDILAMKKNIEALPQVESVSYTSRDDALNAFKARHQNDYLIVQALDELSDNPLGASLNIKAKDPAQYESIARYLSDSTGLSTNGSQSIIDRVNYNQNKAAIDKLSAIIHGVQAIGLGVIVVLVAISMLITFNTIRLAIYAARDEIGVMRLVGASNRYVAGPFIIEGALYGFVAGLATLIVFYPATLYGSHVTMSYFGGMDMNAYYLHNFGELFLVIMGTGIALGAVSSFFAVRRYLLRKYVKH